MSENKLEDKLEEIRRQTQFVRHNETSGLAKPKAEKFASFHSPNLLASTFSFIIFSFSSSMFLNLLSSLPWPFLFPLSLFSSLFLFFWIFYFIVFNDKFYKTCINSYKPVLNVFSKHCSQVFNAKVKQKLPNWEKFQKMQLDFFFNSKFKLKKSDLIMFFGANAGRFGFVRPPTYNWDRWITSNTFLPSTS